MAVPQGRVALVTGGTSGIGHAIATGLAEEGHHVVLLVRDAARGEDAIGRIRQRLPQASLALVPGDLASLASIRLAARKFQSQHDRLHVLVNAAGVFLPTRTTTVDGIESTFATNYLGHFLLTQLLLPQLKKGAPSRIVNVASRYGGAKIDFDDLMVEKRRFSYLKAVPATKLAQVLFTQELAERLAGSGVVVNAAHPGLVAHTRLLEQTRGFFRWLTNTVGATPEKGADTPLWLATSPEAATVSGRLWAGRKPLKTPGQGSDPAARKRLWQESERLLAAGATPARR